MINESDGLGTAIDCDTAHHVRRIGPLLDIGQGIAVHDGVILHLQLRVGVDQINDKLTGLCHRVVTGEVQAPLHRAVDVCCGAALGVGEKTIAAGECQAAFLTHHRTGYDLQLKSQVLHHAADDGNLLVVLLTEVGACGLHEGEQLGHYLADAIEMSGTESPFHDGVCGRIGELAGIWFRIDFCHTGRESDLCTTGLQQAAVGLQRARITFQVTFVVELCGIQEDAHHGDVILFHRPSHEGGVPLVESTHRGYQTYCLACLTGGIELCTKLRNGFYNIHYVFLGIWGTVHPKNRRKITQYLPNKEGKVQINYKKRPFQAFY